MRLPRLLVGQRSAGPVGTPPGKWGSQFGERSHLSIHRDSQRRASVELASVALTQLPGQPTERNLVTPLQRSVRDVVQKRDVIDKPILHVLGHSSKALPRSLHRVSKRKRQREFGRPIRRSEDLLGLQVATEIGLGGDPEISRSGALTHAEQRKDRRKARPSFCPE